MQLVELFHWRVQGPDGAWYTTRHQATEEDIRVLHPEAVRLPMTRTVIEMCETADERSANHCSTPDPALAKRLAAMPPKPPPKPLAPPIPEGTHTHEQVLAAIALGEAHVEGEALDTDAAARITAMRCRVSIDLRNYTPPPGADESAALEAEWRVRLELERLLRGPERVWRALRACETARDHTRAHLTKDERSLPAAWYAAAGTARAAGRQGLEGAEGSWFEIKTLPPPRSDLLLRDAAAPDPPPPPSPVPPLPDQGSLF